MIRTCRVNGLDVRLDVTSNTEHYRAESYATKEPETLEWIDSFISGDDVLYDIGANIGLYSLYAVARHSGITVLSLEPEALNYAQLNRNIIENGMSGRVLPCCAAACETVCLRPLNVHSFAFTKLEDGKYQPGSAMHAFGEAKDYNGQAFSPYHTQVNIGVSIDSLWKQFDQPFPNHIKIDVDGLEELICQGMRQTCQDSRLKSVLIEICLNAGNQDPVFAFFTSLGFRQYDQFKEHSHTQLVGSPYEGCYNTVFIR